MGWLVIALAPFVGSLLGVLIRRIPDGKPIFLDRSRCESCDRQLAPHELVPLLSYVVQHGRCRSCHARIDPFHPTVELAATAVALVAWLVRGDADPRLWGDVALGWTLLALAWIDLRCWRLPDVLTLPLLLAGLGEAVLAGDPFALESRAVAVIAGWSVLTAIALGYRRMRGRDGLGGGDAKLFAAGGAWTGTDALPHILLVSAICGLTLALVTLSRGRPMGMGTAMPFGPCLAVAIWGMRLASF
ncbi:prepilin peptidase [Gluconacetobacter tumulisoli]|uniref:Prepilin leader peptidase/N-methyltransferase n=1 Tax=Gluconacetobacter tumulisoli TaxID=1286189 RepID=A0A7W4K6Z5_9PROT|nr:A24 family peptidase [Gluconacetobacter tumulisoli]MBB2201453.1 prepilin peptidase [Gluconacetobacter tumulisoli]